MIDFYEKNHDFYQPYSRVFDCSIYIFLKLEKMCSAYSITELIKFNPLSKSCEDQRNENAENQKWKADKIC